jgi:hypothetical protein
MNSSTGVIGSGCHWAFRRTVRGQEAPVGVGQRAALGWLRGRGVTWEEASGGDEATALAGNGGDGEAAAGELALQLLRPRRHHPFGHVQMEVERKIKPAY